MFWSMVIAFLVVCCIRYAYTFHQNLTIARKSGLPYMLLPVQLDGILMASVFETRIAPYIVNNWLPRGLADRINGATFKSCWTVKDRLSKKYGGIYLLVTPVKLTCYVSDASVISQMYNARRNVPKPSEKYGLLAVFGPNLLTCTDHDWSHHRRYTSMSFTERNNSLVWQESIRLVTEMKDHWVAQYSRPSLPLLVLPDSREDILKLTLDVICGAGFGVKLPFKPASQASVDHDAGLFRDSATPPPNYHFTFRSVMEYMNLNMISVFAANAAVPKWIPRAVFPFFKTAFAAHDDLSSYLRALLSTTGTGQTNKHNLLEGLVKSRRANGNQQSGNAEARSSQDPGLLDEEIQGNLYIFTLAGHETTATTLRFALVLLALRSGIQDEIFKGIQEATSDEPPNPAEWDYTRVFPKLIGPLCVMLETLRLFPPVVSIPKSTANIPFQITYRNRSCVVPPSIAINLSAHATHYCEEYWGPNAHDFDPKRWDKRNAESYLAKNDDMEGLSAPGLEYANIHKPVRGAFYGFSDGFRACIGKKFAQVEFVVALTLILREYRVEVAKTGEHETDDDARRRAQQALDDSSAFITLTMRDEVPLLLQKRNRTAEA